MELHYVIDTETHKIVSVHRNKNVAAENASKKDGYRMFTVPITDRYLIRTFSHSNPREDVWSHRDAIPYMYDAKGSREINLDTVARSRILSDVKRLGLKCKEVCVENVFDILEEFCNLQKRMYDYQRELKDAPAYTHSSVTASISNVMEVYYHYVIDLSEA